VYSITKLLSGLKLVLTVDLLGYKEEFVRSLEE
jgi:hypothetical protein